MFTAEWEKEAAKENAGKGFQYTGPFLQNFAAMPESKFYSLYISICQIHRSTTKQY